MTIHTRIMLSRNLVSHIALVHPTTVFYMRDDYRSEMAIRTTRYALQLTLTMFHAPFTYLH